MVVLCLKLLLATGIHEIVVCVSNNNSDDLNIDSSNVLDMIALVAWSPCQYKQESHHYASIGLDFKSLDFVLDDVCESCMLARRLSHHLHGHVI